MVGQRRNLFLAEVVPVDRSADDVLEVFLVNKAVVIEICSREALQNVRVEWVTT